MQSFVEGDSWIVTQVVSFPRAKVLEVFAAIGDLDDLRILHDRIIAFRRRDRRGRNPGLRSQRLASGRCGAWLEGEGALLRLSEGHVEMGGGSDTTQNTQRKSVQQLPPWINEAAQQNYAFAQNVAQQPLQQYQGQMVADVGPQTQQAWNTAATSGTAGQDQYNAAQAGLLSVLGTTNTPAAQAALAKPSESVG